MVAESTSLYFTKFQKAYQQYLEDCDITFNTSVEVDISKRYDDNNYFELSIVIDKLAYTFVCDGVKFDGIIPVDKCVSGMELVKLFERFYS